MNNQIKNNPRQSVGMSNKLMAILFLLFGGVALQAQNISTQTVTWNSVKAVNQADNKDAVYNCSFKTNSNQSVDWIQGTHVANFTVTSVDGQWTDLSQDGQTTFHVENGSITGSIMFSRTSGQYTLHLILNVDGKPDQDYVFTITSISAAQ